MNSKAFWISPAMEILNVKINHISEVIDNPEHFGLTYNYIKAIYNDEHEVLRTEGRARKRIIIDLIQQGWIRIREYPKRASWTVNVFEMNEQVLYVLNSWTNEMIHSGVSPFDEVVIDIPDKRKTYSMKEIS